MEFLFITILLVSCFSTITAFPKNYESLSKDSYKRQILQPIPGYIPVYIRADEPFVTKQKSDNLPSPLLLADSKGKANDGRTNGVDGLPKRNKFAAGKKERSSTEKSQVERKVQWSSPKGKGTFPFAVKHSR